MNPLIHELHYSNTNTYLIKGAEGYLLFDTGWAGTFPDFCRACGAIGIPVQSIRYLLISHFHPDHYGIAQEIADQGAEILVSEVQKPFLHSADAVFEKEQGILFVPIRDEMIRCFPVEEGREILKEIGIEGQIIHTPGHSDDSISLCLDNGVFFVGDLNPLYELELHNGTQTGESWKKLLQLNPKTIYYGHAKTACIDRKMQERNGSGELFSTVSSIMRLTDKGLDIEKICRKTGAKEEFVEDVMRMYLTHRDVGVQGILDRIEMKGR